jgi:hypothetical protein
VLIEIEAIFEDVQVRAGQPLAIDVTPALG